jgi:hypothetical protein
LIKIFNMAQQIIDRGTIPNDGTGDTAYVFSGKINANFTELYGQIPVPTILINKTGSVTQNIDLMTWVDKLIVYPQLGVPYIKIGTTDGGDEILSLTPIGDSMPILIQQFYSTGSIFYFTISGGNANIIIDQQKY